MNDDEKSREMLAAENVSLRRELFALRKERNLAPDAGDENECGKILVNEVPEYLYSIEFSKGEMIATFHSPQCEKITGYTPLEYAENPNLWMEMIHKNDRERVSKFLEGLNELLNCKAIEHRIIHKDGSVRWVLNMTTVHTDNKGSTLRQSGFLIDVTERRENEARNLLAFNENRRNALIDDLTGLYNRRGFRLMAEQQLRIAARINQPVLLFYIDVDRFKQTNDTFGHAAGDDLLIALAEILKASFRESDLIGRAGGDEFTVLTMETSLESKKVLIERLHATIEKKNKEAGDAHNLSVSVGIARYIHCKGETITSLIDRADKDMYEKKRSRTTMVTVENKTPEPVGAEVNAKVKSAVDAAGDEDAAIHRSFIIERKTEIRS
jgi:diguanylate cyclase (GGDEF)-like protein/PAS domain S-box-containing protein